MRGRNGPCRSLPPDVRALLGLEAASSKHSMEELVSRVTRVTKCQDCSAEVEQLASEGDVIEVVTLHRDALPHLEQRGETIRALADRGRAHQERRGTIDTLTLLRQLGVVPPQPE
jgi:hypothetical protein